VGVTRYHRPRKHFATIRNSFLRDAQLSLRAFRVGGYVLSHADGFTQTQAQIATGTSLSIGTVRAALRDLAERGYLASKIIREHGRVVGTAYAVSDTPFTPEEVAALTSEDVASEPCAKSVPTESVPPKKTRSRRDSSTGEENQPSGGAAGAASVEEEHAPEENDMPTATDPAQAQLFELDSPEPPAAEARKPEGAQAVIAAYVEAWHEHNAVGEPQRAGKGRIARDAKAMLAKGEATEEELVAAAREMASGVYFNLGVQLNILRRRRAGRGTGNVPPVPQEDPGWAEGERRQDAARAATSPDPALVDLRSRYLQVGAA